ncbi:hypothetical protein MO867_22080 [Microbulbifer sp. OS29]|uniref:Peptidase MA superfamily protein n=1 Tax=Microbulbifer okhotskensis TaxID=2926617 RepID=A0A9X2ESJ1_9GAMM|nr:hypothetical protein [Microbulbifer okhotskensis]MCO1337016.1 hypothetical protein [Microbulbifer okhotskensis]
MYKVKLVIAGLFSVLAVVTLVSQRYVMACAAVQFLDYEEVAPDIFISPGIENVSKILEIILEARERVGVTFGPMMSSPRIILTARREEAARLGANSTATTHYIPLGACIVLAPKGQNVDVAAHELVHAEVGYRVGWLTHWLEIPVWFNEGVALIIDQRSSFLVDNINVNQATIETVKQLNTGREFFSGDNVHRNYLASRLAVEAIEHSNVYEKLALIRSGKSFDSVFEIL